MQGMFSGNWLTIGLMGVLLLLASALGRVGATSLHHWLNAPPRIGAEAPAGYDLAALADLRPR